VSRPQILYLTSSWPHDQSFGGQIRALQIGRALQKVGQVTVAVVSSDTATSDVIKRAADEFAVEPPVRVNLEPNRGLIPRLQWALNPRFLNVHGCVANAADRERLLKRLNDFDLVWVQNSRTPNILNQWDWPRAVLDIDDLPSAFQRTVWQNGAGLNEKLKAGVRMRLLQRRERFWKDRFSVLSVCSEADRQHLGGGEHVHVIPNGFERPANEPVRKPLDPPRIGFIGLYSYSPNLEGMKWFLRECWPLIKRQVPDVRLRLVGKDSDGPLKPNAQDVDALGYVADPADEIATWSAMIIPVRHGAGTRVKIADAFSRKSPVVSTHLGAHGYDVKDGRELLLADHPKDFADACVSVIRDRAAATAMAERAYAAFLEKWTWDAIAPRVWAAAEDALALARGQRSEVRGQMSEIRRQAAE
jgi:glycosyltransferase involved in cell wall biosynthesis